MQKRSPSSRRHPRRNQKNGSIMIMVVALLVLMALIGTAYIATSRIDRGSASQNADNVQIDLLVQSVLNMCKTSVAGDDFDGNGDYRSVTTKITPTPPPGPADTWLYNHTTSTHYDPTAPAVRFDHWLADRVPEFGATGLNSTNHYFWNRISLSLTTESEVISGNVVPVRSYFEDPTYVQLNASDPTLLRFRFDTELEPTSKAVNGLPMPAFFVKTGISSLPDPYRALAADTDGDGVADSFLTRMPIGQINGLTYYYAVRIIDNAAAINLNTAFGDFASMSTNQDGWGRRWFPSSINLNQFFSPNEIRSIHGYRTQRGFAQGLTSLTPADLNSPQPDDPKRAARPDFGFINEHDAFWHGLGQRPENPGFVPKSSGATLRYRSFPLGDLISLVPHFVLAPPPRNASSVVETQLIVDTGNGNSLAGPAQSAGVTREKPYAPDDINNNAFSWGSQNFDYDGNVYSRRPLVVTSNSVSNSIPARVMPTTVAIDINEDGDKTNDVATRDMLDYRVSREGKFNNPSPPIYHLFEFDLTKTPPDKWDTSWTYNRGDYVQFNLGNGLVQNYIYARSTPKTNNTSDPRTANGAKYWEFIPNLPDGTPMKASLNTAGFRELYRAYWSVMAGKTSNSTPYGNYGPQLTEVLNPYDRPHVQKQFRSSIRDIHTPFSSNFTCRFEPFQQLLLRAALAAVNTIDLRDSDNDITSRTIVLQAHTRDGLRPVEVTVYGAEAQPFITEVYANSNSLTDETGDQAKTKNPRGYVAVELFNPYPDRTISLSNWKLGLIDRRRNRKAPGAGAADPIDDGRIRIRTLLTFGTNDKTIPPGGHLVLENFKTGTDQASPNAAVYRPAQAQANGDFSNRKYVPDLGLVFEDNTKTPNEPGGELVLLRPRRADNQLANGSPIPKGERPYDLYNENNIYDLVPVDSFDFTGLRIKPAATANTPQDVYVWHYLRSNGTGDNRWKCVYPGRYDGGKGNSGADPDGDPRQEADSLKITITETPPAIFNGTIGGPTVSLGKPDGGSTTLSATRAAFPPIQLNNIDFAGPNRLHQPTPQRNYFPFGGFLRAGDIMQVPYMGAYRVRQLNGSPSDPTPDSSTGGYQLPYGADVLIELNSLPMDSSFADDSIDDNNQFENIGRFCPLLPFLTGYPIQTDPNNQADYGYWKAHSYDFATRVFDYFTVLAPNESYFPNINPDPTLDPLKSNTSAYRYLTGTQYRQIVTGANYPDAEPVKSIDNGSFSGAAQQIAGVHGLININTANWKVLSAVPWTDNASENERIAKAIVQQRDVGYLSLSPKILPAPYQSIFELLNVRNPQNPSQFLFEQYQPTANDDPDDLQGDFSPFFDGNKDEVTAKYEFEKAYLLITRVSNLLTTRSDSFTAYVLVQGWRNANSSDPNNPPQLVVQRRAAMLIDRSGVTPKNREPRSMLIPVE